MEKHVDIGEKDVQVGRERRYVHSVDFYTHGPLSQCLVNNLAEVALMRCIVEIRQSVVHFVFHSISLEVDMFFFSVWNRLTDLFLHNGLHAQEVFRIAIEVYIARIAHLGVGIKSPRNLPFNHCQAQSLPFDERSKAREFSIKMVVALTRVLQRI